jgi:hypothetical protein
MPADITLLMVPGAAAPPAPDASWAAADALPPDDLSGVEALEADLHLPDPAVEPVLTTLRPAVWPAVLIDLTLLAAVAAAGAVYLLLH